VVTLKSEQGGELQTVKSSITVTTVGEVDNREGFVVSVEEVLPNVPPNAPARIMTRITTKPIINRTVRRCVGEAVCPPTRFSFVDACTRDMFALRLFLSPNDVSMLVDDKSFVWEITRKVNSEDDEGFVFVVAITN